MATLRQIADRKYIMAYGTSEGVSKAWDTRGRGRKTAPSSGNKSRVAAPQNKRVVYQKLKKEYDTLGKDLQRMHGKLDSMENVHSTWGKFIHLLKDIGEWHDAWGNIRDLIVESAATLWLLKGAAHAQTVHNALVSVHAHLAPVMHRLATAAMSTAGGGLFGEAEVDNTNFSLRAAIDGKAYGQLR